MSLCCWEPYPQPNSQARIIKVSENSHRLQAGCRKGCSSAGNLSFTLRGWLPTRPFQFPLQILPQVSMTFLTKYNYPCCLSNWVFCFKHQPIFVTLHMWQWVVRNHFCQLQSLKLATYQFNFTRNGSFQMGPERLTEHEKNVWLNIFFRGWAWVENNVQWFQVLPTNTILHNHKEHFFFFPFFFFNGCLNKWLSVTVLT